MILLIELFGQRWLNFSYHNDKLRRFWIFLLRCCNVHCMHSCFLVKLAFNFICTFFNPFLYFASSHFSVTYQFYGFIHDLFLPVKYAFWYYYLARSKRLFVNTTQQWAVFRLTKCRDFTLYSMLLFLLLLIVFKEFPDNRELILGNFFFLWPNGFFLETKLVIKDGHDSCLSLYVLFYQFRDIFCI